jgi:hypothetical protein
MRFLFTFLFLLVFCTSWAGDSLQYQLKINFLYGSKPAKGYKQSESKYFGGLKGGHVNIEAGNRVLDFLPGDNPLFPKNKKPSGGFRLNETAYKHKEIDKWTTIIVPVNEEQFKKLQKLFDSVSVKTPYDYAIFGMRCAAASYDVLSEIGLFKEIPNSKNVAEHFYPKLLRKKVLKWAEKNNYSIIKNEGRPSRKWESDKGLL